MKRHGGERNWTRLPKWGKGRPLEGMTSVLGPEDRNKGTKQRAGKEELVDPSQGLRKPKSSEHGSQF